MNTALEDYCRRYAQKKVAFLGVGVSHTGIIPEFVKAGARVTVCEGASVLSDKALAALDGLDVELKLGPSYLEGLSSYDLIFRSPGITPLLPEIKAAIKSGSVLTGEVELFFDLCPAHTIGVTGSDGKTTTTTLIHEMLLAAGHTAYIGGNIGDPLLPRLKLMDSSDYVAAELSSFQLMTFKTSPDVAVVTNIHQNHLDYHRDMAEYIAAKQQILLHGARAVVLNADDPTVCEMAAGLDCEKRYFSARGSVENGAFVADGAIWLARHGKKEKLADISELHIPGFHNAVNSATAAAAAMDAVPAEAMRSVLTTFEGVKHRIQFVKKVRGVSYYNDSIATTPSRTVVCLRSFPAGSILIAGGSDKGVDYTEMARDVIDRVKLLILTGATAEKIEAAVTGCGFYFGTPKIVHAKCLEDAVKLAFASAEAGDNVLLSPASASFDCFKNYGMRGDRFMELVNDLS